MSLITSENAVEMARLSAERRKERRKTYKVMEKRLASIPQPTPLSDRIWTIERQIDAIDKAMAKAKPMALPALWRAKETALNLWADLTGFPRRGVRKAGRERNPVPAPQPVVTPVPNPVPGSAQETNG